jgi:uncharacterized membrane protein YidH (DUF202 family)
MADDIKKPDDALDPRVYFAAERTLLAWVRTGLALMGFGFVVARFPLPSSASMNLVINLCSSRRFFSSF